MIIPLILCGGIGKRLWPLSTECKPKQFHHIISPLRNNIQYILDKFSIGANFKSPIISCNYKHLKLIESSLRSFHLEKIEIMVEPAIKGTGSAICYITEYLSKNHNEEDFILILPSDIFIENEKEFLQKVNRIYLENSEDIICFGVCPNYPSSEFGYIKKGTHLSKDFFRVSTFIEKPEMNLAKLLMSENKWLWNIGVFFGKIKIFKKEFIKHFPALVKSASYVTDNLTRYDNKIFAPKKYYDFFSDISIDKALIEKTSKLKLMKLNSRWFDLGNWENISNFDTIESQNIKLIESQNCYVNMSHNKAVLLGLKDIIVVEQKNKIFITTKEYASKMKNYNPINQNAVNSENKKIDSKNWGNIINLHISTKFILRYLEILPGHTADFEGFKNQNVFLTLIKGRASLQLNHKEVNLELGKTFNINTKENYKILNKDIEVVYILEASQDLNINSQPQQSLLQNHDFSEKNISLN